MFSHDTCACPDGQSCTDIILTDINMPNMKGLDFVESQRAKGCNCQHVALMSGDFTSDDEKRAKKLGLGSFRKSFQIAEVFHWLDEAEEKIKPHRRLTEFQKLCN